MNAGTGFFGDDPVDGSPARPDRMDRAQYCQHVAALLDRVRKQSESSVLAVIGPWGSGKSSVLNLTVQRLMARPPGQQWRVASFNPWIYSDLESMQLGFFSELRDCLTGDAQWSEARRRLGDFGNSITPIAKVAGLLGVDASGALASMSKLLAGDTSAAATRAKAEQALRKIDQPILMVLDDLDRLAPDELLLVLKLVRLVGRLPNVYYVLSYDERTLLDVLSRTALVASDDEGRARDYLEKIVQVRLDLPRMRTSQSDALVNAAFESVTNNSGLELDPAALHRMGRVYQEHLRDRLTTPRSINRFFGQVDAFYATVGEEVDFVDFVLITWIRTFEPGTYELVQRHKSALTGTGIAHLVGKRSSPAEQLVEWRDRLSSAGVDKANTEGVLTVLSSLFIPVKSAQENMTYGSTYYDSLGQNRRVGHVDYFDRYFTFGVPSEDIADSDVARALARLASPGSDESVERLATALVEKTDRTIRKIMARQAEEGVPNGPLLRLLGQLYFGLPKGTTTLFTDNPKFDFEVLAGDLLSRLDEREGLQLISELGATDPGLHLVSRAVRRMSPRDEDHESRPEPRRLNWSGSAYVAIAQLLKARLSQLSEPLEDVPEDVFEFLWEWRMMDQESATEWLRQRVLGGQWDLLDVLVRLVPVGTSYGGDGPPTPTLGDIEMGLVDELFGLEYVFQQLGDLLDDAEVKGRWHLEPSPEATRDYVLGRLKSERDQRASTTDDNPSKPDQGASDSTAPAPEN